MKEEEKFYIMPLTPSLDIIYTLLKTERVLIILYTFSPMMV